MALNGHMSGRVDPAPVAGFDVTLPNVARIYDYLLGGKDNFTADRGAAEELLRHIPDAQAACHSNREFLRRAVRFLAGEAGIRQFVDIGTGLPTQENVHEVAQEIRHDARVVYVDNDPVVVKHAEALLAKSPAVAVINGDLRNPDEILANPALRALINFAEPVAILLVASLHFIADEDGPCSIMRTLKAATVPGSYLALSHITVEQVEEESAVKARAVYERATEHVFPRWRAAITHFFEGMEIIEPGVVDVRSWHPGLSPHEPGRILMYAGVARKPVNPRVTETGPRTPDTGDVTDAEITVWSRAASARLRIAARLARDIRDGRYRDWRPLPSGAALAREYDVSSSTANRAQRLLAERGMIRREGNCYFAAPGEGHG